MPFVDQLYLGGCIAAFAVFALALGFAGISSR